MKTKKYLLTLFFAALYCSIFSQIPVTAVTTGNQTASSSAYSSAGNNYNWGNGNNVLVNGFTAGGNSYSYASALAATVKMRRVNNANVSGNFTLIWAEASDVTAPTFTMLPNFQNNMDVVFNGRTYNMGADNFLDNTSTNSNNIERLDWILTTPYTATAPSKIGFAIFDRGSPGAHDPFCIAAILSKDGLGNPSSYSNVVRVVAANYGDPGPNVDYEIVKGTFPAMLVDAGSATQGRGGTYITLQNMGVAPGTTVHGYSIFANDLPLGATSANLIDYTNGTYFPTNTAGAGGIDLIAVTGMYTENSTLPVKFINFSGAENNNLVLLQWLTENEVSIDRYEVERSTDGIHFYKIKETAPSSSLIQSGKYAATDDISSINSQKVWYRINQVDSDGLHSYSKTIIINRKQHPEGLSVFPNPSSNEVFISTNSSTNSRASLSLFNAAGIKVTEQKILIVKGNNSFSFNDIQMFPKGIYQLVLRREDGVVLTKKMVKE